MSNTENSGADQQRQPPLYPIIGARTLTQAEIDLINKVKKHADATESLINEVRAFHLTEVAEFRRRPNGDELARLVEQGQHWRSRATDELQSGFMKLVRSLTRQFTFA